MPTTTLAEYIVKTSYVDIPAEIRETAKRCFLDWLGSAYCGSKEQPAQVLRDIIRELGGKEEATVIGSETQSTCLQAALANGSASSLVEADDSNGAPVLSSVTPVIPAALATAEREGRGGKDLLRAIILGYEASSRIEEALGPPGEGFPGVSSAAGSLGAAVAAGTLLELSVDQMASLLASDRSHSLVLPGFPTDGLRSQHARLGSEAMDGVLAALMAKKVLLGWQWSIKESGSRAVNLEQSRHPRLTAGLGESYGIAAVSTKAHASSRPTHAAIDATLDIVKKLDLADEDVEEVVVRVCSNVVDLLSDFEASDLSTVKRSMPYCIASAVVFRSVGWDRFGDDLLRDVRLRRMMGKVKVEVDPSLDKSYPAKSPAVVRVVTKSGMKLVANVDYPKGDPRNPLSREELSDKFRAIAPPVLGTDRVETLLGRVWDLDRLPNVAGLLAGLA